jgi:hypothetical protein
VAGLLTKDLAERLGVGLKQIDAYIEAGLLAADQVALDGFPGKPMHVICWEEAERFEREWWRHPDPEIRRRRLWFLDSENAIAHKKRTGWFEKRLAEGPLTAGALEALIRSRVEERRRRAARHRRTGPRPAEHVERWRHALRRIEAQQRASHARDAGPSVAARELYRRELSEHADYWDPWLAKRGNPNASQPGVEREAVNTILTAARWRR